MSDVERIKDAIRIEDYIMSRCPQLRRVGNLYKMSCPRHNDKTPSFVVNPEFQTWKDYGACGVGGDVFKFVMWFDGASFEEAKIELARYANVELTPFLPQNKEKHEKRQRLYDVLERSTVFYERMLFSSHGRLALKYLQEDRGLSMDTIKDSRLGFAPASGILLEDFSDQEMIDTGLLYRDDKNAIHQCFWSRIMIPICDHKGRVVGFSGRAVLTKQDAKYKNTRETDVFKKSSLIYKITPMSRVKNGHSVAHDGSQVKVVTEGHIDVISAYNRGFKNVCAQMGTELTDEQLRLLCKDTKRLVFCLDNDEAGNAAIKRLVEKHMHTALLSGVDLYVMRNPHKKDVDDTMRERPELWQPAVDAARPAVDVLIERACAALSKNASVGDKQSLSRSLLPLLRAGDDEWLRKDNTRKLAVALGEDENTLIGWVTQQTLKVVSHIPTPKPTQVKAYTQEESVLHSILRNCYEGWLGMINGQLTTLTPPDVMLPYALAPLSLNDFTEDVPRQMMALINDSLKQDDVDMTEYVMSRMDHNEFNRVFEMDTALRIMGYGFDASYATFKASVFHLRALRLERDAIYFQGKDEDKWMECMTALAYLQTAREAL